MDNRVMRSYVERVVKGVERGVLALEAIADAIEQQNASDPLTMLHAAIESGMQIDGMPDTGISMPVEGEQSISRQRRDRQPGTDDAPGESAVVPAPFPAPFASNGTLTFVYRHPDPQYVLVLSRDEDVPGGYVASVQEK